MKTLIALFLSLGLVAARAQMPDDSAAATTAAPDASPIPLATPASEAAEPMQIEPSPNAAPPEAATT